MNVTGWTERGSPGRWALAAVAAGALALRLWHLGWGLPDLYEEATPLFRAWGFWNWGGRGLDLNPHFFNYPALSFLVQFLLQAMHAGVGFVAGAYPDLNAFQSAWSSDLPRFVLLGRLPGVLFDTGTVVITGMLAGRLIDRRAGLVAAAMAAVNPLQIGLSQMIGVDAMLAFFCSSAVLAMIGLAESGGMKRALQAGLLVGLAAATKYTGAVLLAPLVLATMIGMRHGPPRAAAPASTVARVSAVLSPVILAYLVFLVLNPFVLFDTAGFLRDFGFEQTHMAAGHFGVPAGESTPLYYLMDALPGAIGWPALVLCIPGIVRAVRSGDHRWLVPALGFGVLLIIPMFWTMRAERYMLPALPGMVTLFAAGLAWFWPRRVGWTTATASVLLVAGFAQPLLASFNYHRSMLEPDTRAGASAWIRRNLPAGAAIVLTPAGVNIDSSYVQLPIPYLAVGLEGVAALYDARWYTDMDLLVGSSFDRGRYMREPSRYAAFMQFFYDSLAARWRTVWSGEPGPTRRGPGIWLFAPLPRGRGESFPPELLARLETVTTPRSLTVFAANLASVLDAKGRGDRARQVRAAAIGQLMRRFPGSVPSSLAILSSMAPDPDEIRAMADSVSRIR